MNLFWFALFGIIVLIILAIIGNTSESSLDAVEEQIFLMNCPFPINGGTADNLAINGLTVSYDLARNNSTEDYDLTLFNCRTEGATLIVETTVLTTANNWFNVAGSYLAYSMNLLFVAGAKIQAIMTLFSFIITPANFSIFGFTLADIGGAGLMFVVGIYVMCYAFIGTWLWVTFNPFRGGTQ